MVGRWSTLGVSCRSLVSRLLSNATPPRWFQTVFPMDAGLNDITWYHSFPCSYTTVGWDVISQLPLLTGGAASDLLNLTQSPDFNLSFLPFFLLQHMTIFYWIMNKCMSSAVIFSTQVALSPCFISPWWYRCTLLLLIIHKHAFMKTKLIWGQATTPQATSAIHATASRRGQVT